MTKIRYSNEQITRLSHDPNIRDISSNRLRFTLEFRQKIYDAVKDHIGYPAIRRFLTSEGYDCRKLGITVIDTLSKDFKRHGRPKNENRTATSKLYNHDKSDDAILLKSGKFCKSGNGITFTDEFINELYHNYPEQSIEEGIRAAGIDPEIVGYQRMAALKRRFDDKEPERRSQIHTDAFIDKYKNHPYVKRVTAKTFVLEEAFYNEASSLAGINIDDLMDAYQLDHKDFSLHFRNNLKYKLTHWKKTEAKITDSSMQTIQIQYQRMEILERLLTDKLGSYKKVLSSMTCRGKKAMCLMIASMPQDADRQYTVSWYLKSVGLPRSTYYEILRNDDYGVFEEKKSEQDQKDIAVIQNVIAYKGFGKGSRQIYMDMKDITGEQFGLKKIRRLMRKAGIKTGIRVQKEFRIAARERLERNKKPNLLKRRFRLYEPNQVRLTDVTYLDYCHGKKRAYGSASKDPVTGKCIDFTISENNDLELAEETLNHIKDQPLAVNPILHSDQGALYLTDEFQEKVKEAGMMQSMSKRGNCWDNAPQESFFGHFKDEADYEACKTIEELITVCTAYKDYYNNERHQWNLNKMTPVQYEQYLLHMTPEEKADYMAKEEKKYRDMKERAAKEAKEHALTLGV